MCIRPWADIGRPSENALSMREGVPSSPIARSSGPCGKPRCGPSSGIWPGLDVLLQWGLGCGGDRLGVGRLVAETTRGNRPSPAGSAAHACGRSGTRWNGPRSRASRASTRAARSSCRACAPASVQGGRGRSPPRRPRARSRRRCPDLLGRDTRRLGHRLGRIFHRRGSVRPSARRSPRAAAVGLPARRSRP
jgi:hypothetical protein